MRKRGSRKALFSLGLMLALTSACEGFFEAPTIIDHNFLNTRRILTRIVAFES